MEMRVAPIDKRGKIAPGVGGILPLGKIRDAALGRGLIGECGPGERAGSAEGSEYGFHGFVGLFRYSSVRGVVA